MGRAFKRATEPAGAAGIKAVGGGPVASRAHERAPQGSDATPERLSRGYFETPEDPRVVQIVTFRDDALYGAFRAKIIDRRELEAGNSHYENWYSSGLAPHIPCMGAEFVVSGKYDWDYLPKNDMEAYHRKAYWTAAHAMGRACAQIVELVACHNQNIKVLELGWPNAEINLKNGLKILAGA